MIDQGIARPGTGNEDDRSGKCHAQYVMGSIRAHERRSGDQMMYPPDARAIDLRVRFNDKYGRLPGLPSSSPRRHQTLPELAIKLQVVFLRH